MTPPTSALTSISLTRKWKMESWILVSKPKIGRNPKSSVYPGYASPKPERDVVDLCQGLSGYVWPNDPASFFGLASEVSLGRWIRWLVCPCSASPVPPWCSLLRHTSTLLSRWCLLPRNWARLL